jgi:hypothetical protein
VYEASHVIASGSLDVTDANVSVAATDDAGNVTTTADDTQYSVDNEAPTVTATNIAVITTGNGAGGEFVIGDTVTVQWDNSSATGDGNQDIATVTVDFSQFGGGAAVAATDMGGGVYEASSVIASGSQDVTDANVSVTATDDAGNVTTTADDTQYSVDNEAPIVTAANIAVITTGSGAGGEFVVGDIVTVQWDNSVATGDGNQDIATVTVDFSQFGGGATVAATDIGSGVYEASYEIESGSLNVTDARVSLTATDDAGNITTTLDDEEFAVNNT